MLDPFGGSGTTLIACEKAGRQARLIELEPKYCDVIVRRWQEFSGKEAVLEADGRTFAGMAAERLQRRRMNRPLPPGDRGHRAGNTKRQPRPDGAVPGAVGLVRRSCEFWKDFHGRANSSDLIPATGLISGLIGAFVGLQNRALLAEVRKELAELENRIFTRINGTYVRSGECQLARGDMFMSGWSRWRKRSGTETPPACEAGGVWWAVLLAPMR